MNILHITQKQDGSNDLSLLSTPYYKIYGVKLDYGILFLFDTISSFCCFQDSNHHHNSFKSQCVLGIVLGCTEFTNSMVFYNLICDRFCTSTNYLIDKN